MVNLKPRFEAFVKLGKFLRDFCENANTSQVTFQTKNHWFKTLEAKIELSRQHYGWFTQENVYFALSKWGFLLTGPKIKQWLGNYDLDKNNKKVVALVMAGNIPLVGFHDFLTVLLTGNSALIKLSSNDRALLPFMAEFLIDSEPSLEDAIIFTQERLHNYDAVIATGSNNTARYFEHYFGKKPNVIRKNRNSVAVLTGDESSGQLEALGEDIFRYYGLGCRNVSKLLVPKDYSFEKFFKALFKYKDILEHNKYANNYDYNKAVYLMSEFKILDNGFLMLKEDGNYASPIATLFYETYDTLDNVRERLARDHEKIQCVVSSGVTMEEIHFGSTQNPSLLDYADGVDTVDFLLKT